MPSPPPSKQGPMIEKRIMDAEEQSRRYTSVPVNHGENTPIMRIVEGETPKRARPSAMHDPYGDDFLTV